MTWGDFAITAMVEKAVTARMLRGDWRGVISLLVRLVGHPSEERPSGAPAPSPPDDRQNGLTPRKPLAPALPRPAAKASA
jgi:hypothetical protein